MNDLSLGYVLDGRHFGTGIGIGKLPEAFVVREHVEDGGYVETSYVPERTCSIVGSYTNGPHLEDSDIELSCGRHVNGDPGYPPEYCEVCGARVVEP